MARGVRPIGDLLQNASRACETGDFEKARKLCRLVLKAHPKQPDALHLLREAERRGVAPHRLVFAPRVGVGEHLARHKLADLFLDTLPYNAHTTASDALRAGVPIVTCMGNSFASRVAASLLHAAGVPEFVTHSLDDYFALALRLARDPALLARRRAALADSSRTLPLFDVDRFRRNIEKAYLMMHERHQAGEQPASFSVT
jgi:predicted O-linked N-acetylglucosamine transferase (SPINDLY family)